MSHLSGKPQRREPELDFIRGIAILLVLDFHSPKKFLFTPLQWLGFKHFGWAGVDIFFVLSGFLVGGLLIKEWKVRSSIDSRRFLARRALKIWPQYYFFLLFALISGRHSFSFLLGNFLNVQNYMGGIAHTWTLAVEEHAYLLILIGLAIAAKKKAALDTVFRWVFSTCIVVVLWRFLLAWREVNTFTRTDTRIDGILYGLLLAILYHDRPTQFAKLQRYKTLWLGILAATLLYFRFLPETWWSASLEMLAADISGVALLLLLYQKSEKARGWPYRAMAWIGLHSYGIYLWHVSVISIAVSVAMHLSGRANNAAMILLPPMFGILAGVAMTKLIEFPTLRVRDRFFPRNIDAAVGIPASVEQKTGAHGKKESISL